MGYRLLLSDADGTLFDFHAGERVAIANTFTAFQIPVTEENKALYQRVNEAQWKLLERGETTQSRLKIDRFVIFLQETGYHGDAAEMCDRFVWELGQQRVLLPGAADFCAAVAAQMPIYLVTNGLAAVQRSRFEHCPISAYISDILISQEIGAAKPDPAMVLEALRRAGVAADEAVLLGDSLTADIPAAASAGVDSILFTNGAQAPAGHGAQYVAATLEEAKRLVLSSTPCHLAGKAVK